MARDRPQRVRSDGEATDARAGGPQPVVWLLGPSRCEWSTRALWPRRLRLTTVCCVCLCLRVGRWPNVSRRLCGTRRAMLRYVRMHVCASGCPNPLACHDLRCARRLCSRSRVRCTPRCQPSCRDASQCWSMHSQRLPRRSKHAWHSCRNTGLACRRVCEHSRFTCRCAHATAHSTAHGVTPWFAVCLAHMCTD